jgi:hypothetical protein
MYNPEESLRRCEEERIWQAGQCEDYEIDEENYQFEDEDI